MLRIIPTKINRGFFAAQSPQGPSCSTKNVIFCWLAGSFPFIANFKKLKVKTTDYSSSWLAVFIGVSRSWAVS